MSDDKKAAVAMKDESAIQSGEKGSIFAELGDAWDKPEESKLDDDAIVEMEGAKGGDALADIPLVSDEEAELISLAEYSNQNAASEEEKFEAIDVGYLDEQGIGAHAEVSAFEPAGEVGDETVVVESSGLADAGAEVSAEAVANAVDDSTSDPVDDSTSDPVDDASEHAQVDEIMQELSPEYSHGSEQDQGPVQKITLGAALLTMLTNRKAVRQEQAEEVRRNNLRASMISYFESANKMQLLADQLTKTKTARYAASLKDLPDEQREEILSDLKNDPQHEQIKAQLMVLASGLITQTESLVLTADKAGASMEKVGAFIDGQMEKVDGAIEKVKDSLNDPKLIEKLKECVERIQEFVTNIVHSLGAMFRPGTA